MTSKARTYYVVHSTVWVIHTDEEGEIEKADILEEDEVTNHEGVTCQDEYETYEQALEVHEAITKV